MLSWEVVDRSCGQVFGDNRPESSAAARHRLAPQEPATRLGAFPMVARMDYAAYLASPQWWEKRQLAVKRAHGRCAICNANGKLNVHHRTYERVGNELPEDLIVLCEDCHALFHKKIPPPPPPKPEKAPKGRRRNKRKKGSAPTVSFYEYFHHRMAHGGGSVTSPKLRNRVKAKVRAFSWYPLPDGPEWFDALAKRCRQEGFSSSELASLNGMHGAWMDSWRRYG